MQLASALKGVARHKEALLDPGSVSNPTYISEHAHRLSQYIGVLDDVLADMEAELEINESNSFNEHVKSGKSANASKELIRREFTKERSEIIRLTRLTSSGWKLVSESQSRVKHLIAEATNQI